MHAPRGDPYPCPDVPLSLKQLVLKLNMLDVCGGGVGGWGWQGGISWYSVNVLG